MFIRNQGLAQTVLQFFTHASFTIGSKDTQTIQFVHEGEFATILFGVALV
jgi:hypothetical protein